MKFLPGFQPPSDQDQQALWFILDKGRLLVEDRPKGCRIPETPDVVDGEIHLGSRLFIGQWGDQQCYAAALQHHDAIPDGFVFTDLRSLFGVIAEDLVWVAGRANQLLDWDQSHRYCGRCGQATRDKTDERAKICPRCNLLNYPRLSPAVIVAVIRDGRILLGRNKRFRAPFFSVLAGFVEPSETLEGCVKREVQEEVGIRVKNIRYFGSQPWPFPNSLMIGFVADYAGGEIDVDEEEIMEAGWFAKEALPRIPPKISIARQLIDWFVEGR